MGTDVFNAGGNPSTDKHLVQGRELEGVEIILQPSCFLDLGDKRQPDEPVGSQVDLTVLVIRGHP